MNDGRYDLASGALAGLRKAGVGEKVISAMLASRAKSPPHLRLLDPGVYVTRGDAYALVQTEVVSWRSVANVVDIAGTPFTRLTLYGHVEGPASWLPLSQTAELLIVCEPNGRGSDYQLLQGEVDESGRKFVGEGVLRAGKLLGLSSPHILPITLDNTYDLGVRVRLGGLRKGEYGLVPPGVVSDGRVPTQGRIHTFTVE
jgi:hypothetical protein